MKIVQIDAFPLRLDRHYRVAGHREAPNQLPGTDYYIEPQWVHAYSRVLEALVLKVNSDDGSFGWGEVQAPLTPQTILPRGQLSAFRVVLGCLSPGAGHHAAHSQARSPILPR